MSAGWEGRWLHTPDLVHGRARGNGLLGTVWFCAPATFPPPLGKLSLPAPLLRPGLGAELQTLGALFGFAERRFWQEAAEQGLCTVGEQGRKGQINARSLRGKL